MNLWSRANSLPAVLAPGSSPVRVGRVAARGLDYGTSAERGRSGVRFASIGPRSQIRSGYPRTVFAPARSARAGSTQDLVGGLAITLGGLSISFVVFVLGTQSARRVADTGLVTAGLAAGAVLVVLGVAIRSWTHVGPAGRAVAVATFLCGVALVGPDWFSLVGQLGFVLGIATYSLVAARAGVRPAWALAVEAFGALLILGAAFGQTWLPLAFGLASVVLGVASVGVGRTGSPAVGLRSRGWPIAVALVAVASLVGEAVAVGVPARLANGAPSVPIRTTGLPPMRVVVDTDMLGDDWMAILYLLSEPAVDVEAITVAGTSAIGCDAAADTARRLVEASGRPQVPVSCGPDRPLSGGHFFPPDWGTAAASLAATLGLPPGPDTITSHDAAELIGATATGGSDPIVIVALGPLTNVALALGSPSVPARVQRLVIMGGALDAPGNVSSTSPAEWNIYIDPHAADSALRSGVPTTLVPLDATDHVLVTADLATRLGGRQPTPAATIVGRILGGQADFIASGTYFFWDPLAAAIARDDRLARLTTEHVGVVEDGSDIGRTVRDPSAPAIQVAVNADAAGFERALVEALTGQAR